MTAAASSTTSRTSRPFRSARLAAFVLAGSAWFATPAPAATAVPAATAPRPPLPPDRIRIGTLAPGKLDAITDVAGVRVGQVTKIEGAAGPLVPGVGPVRTGVTAILPNADVWTDRVAAATYVLNGNGEMTGAHWVDESGFLEVPIALTNTLDVGRVDDGVVSYLIGRHPDIGVDEDVPLPVVAECDDQGLNDIQGRHVTAADTVAALTSATSGAFPRGDVGAGTGMRAFSFKAGIGTASRVSSQGDTVGVLVNANTARRNDLVIDGVPVGRELADEYLPSMSTAAARALGHGRAADGSIVVVVATDAPLESRQLREIAKRATFGLARVGSTSSLSSGDLFIAFSTTRHYPRGGTPEPAPSVSDERLDALFGATVEATEAAIVDALLSARSMSGARGLRFEALPIERVRALLRAHGVDVSRSRASAHARVGVVALATEPPAPRPRATFHVTVHGRRLPHARLSTWTTLPIDGAGRVGRVTATPRPHATPDLSSIR